MKGMKYDKGDAVVGGAVLGRVDRVRVGSCEVLGFFALMLLRVGSGIRAPDRERTAPASR